MVVESDDLKCLSILTHNSPMCWSSNWLSVATPVSQRHDAASWLKQDACSQIAYFQLVSHLMLHIESTGNGSDFSPAPYCPVQITYAQHENFLFLEQRNIEKYVESPLNSQAQNLQNFKDSLLLRRHNLCPTCRLVHWSYPQLFSFKQYPLHSTMTLASWYRLNPNSHRKCKVEHDSWNPLPVLLLITRPAAVRPIQRDVHVPPSPMMNADRFSKHTISVANNLPLEMNSVPLRMACLLNHVPQRQKWTHWFGTRVWRQSQRIGLISLVPSDTLTIWRWSISSVDMWWVHFIWLFVIT